MSPPPRRLTFAVSSSLLTASLAIGVAGCDGQPTANPAPEPEPEPPNVNVAAEGPEEPAPEDKPKKDKPKYVNTRPDSIK